MSSPRKSKPRPANDAVSTAARRVTLADLAAAATLCLAFAVTTWLVIAGMPL